jgi:hypothetical protein
VAAEMEAHSQSSLLPCIPLHRTLLVSIQTQN